MPWFTRRSKCARDKPIKSERAFFFFGKKSERDIFQEACRANTTLCEFIHKYAALRTHPKSGPKPDLV